jgi:hypothetical protein
MEENGKEQVADGLAPGPSLPRHRKGEKVGNVALLDIF